MKKIRITGFIVLPMLLLALTALNVRAEAAPDAEPAAEISEAVLMAEEALRQPLDDVPVLGEDAPMPEDMYLTGPYLYVAPAEDGPDDLFIPDQMALHYEPGDLPSGAVIRADETLVQVSEVPEGARALFPVLYCPGYSDSASYISLGTVYYQTYAVLLIDSKTGEAAARIKGPWREASSMMVSKGDYRTDMNEKYVYWFESTPKHLKDMWLDVFTGTAVNGYAVFAEEGEATGMLGDTRCAGGELVIPEGITGIGKLAFGGREDITGVRFPDSLTSVGERAFEECSALKELSLPEGVTLLSYHAFNSCKGLERVSLPESLTEIRYNCFSGCENLSEIELPAGLKELGDDCFGSCAKLTQITIPRNIREIPRTCFYGCTSLERVDFAGPVNRINDYAFTDCSALKSLSFTGNTNFVGPGAFRGCDSLEELSFHVTRRYAKQNWDKAWNEGCTARITWKSDPLPVILLIAGLAAAIAVAAAVMVKKRKK
ncbi:MAG: leucine-rich repeat protein [Lachnospiraceae bacterium]|nr:leucine-rich repeat protein [Lachnospiraceae bacterium]